MAALANATGKKIEESIETQLTSLWWLIGDCVDNASISQPIFPKGELSFDHGESKVSLAAAGSAVGGTNSIVVVDRNGSKFEMHLQPEGSVPVGWFGR